MNLEEIAAQLKKPTGESGKQVREKMNISNELINLLTIEKLNVNHDNILEIGMGNGHFISKIITNHELVNYTGCDFSPTMVDEAKLKNNALVKSGMVKFDLAPAHQLPYTDNAFDKVFTINTIYFWNTPANELSEIKRVLKPTGQFVIAIRPKQTMQHYPFVKFGFNLYSKEDLSKVLIDNGFKILDITETREADQMMNDKMVRVDSVIISANK